MCRVATRYDQLAANYLAFVQLASIRLWLRANESTPWMNRVSIDLRKKRYSKMMNCRVEPGNDGQRYTAA